jgi:hypothetical protein
MSGPRYQIHVDRLVVHGVDAARLDAGELRQMVAAAVARELRGAELPAGRSMTAAVRIEAGALPGEGLALAGAIARGVAQGVGGGGHRG